MELVRELALLVDEPTAGVLERALENEVKVLALTIEDRERILRALDDPPDGLAELRACSSASTSGACARDSSSAAPLKRLI